MTELQILNAVKNNGGSIGYIDLMNMGSMDAEWDSIADKELVETLIKNDILSGKMEAYSLITFGSNGRSRLRKINSDADEASKREADIAAEKAQNKKSQFRHDLKISIITLAITEILHLLFEFLLGA